MSGNTMWLVCAHHPDRSQAFLLCEREELIPGQRLLVRYHPGALGQQVTIESRTYTRSLAKFLATHHGCGGGFDHFTIAYDRDKDHDLPKPAPLADAVHATLRDPPEAANNG